MCLKSELTPSNEEVKVTIPPTRHDVIHACDIYEDVGIAYGYNKIPRNLPNTNTIGAQLPVNKLSDHLRESIAEAGFTEALTFSLVSMKLNNKVFFIEMLILLISILSAHVKMLHQNWE